MSPRVPDWIEAALYVATALALLALVLRLVFI